MKNFNKLKQFNELNSTDKTRDIRNKLWESGDPYLVPLAHNLTDEQIALLRQAFSELPA